MNVDLSSVLSWARVHRWVARFAPLLCFIGVILLCLALYQLGSRWTSIVNKRISNINVIEVAPRPSPTATPMSSFVSGSQSFAIANNELYEQIWQLQQFQARRSLLSARADSVQEVVAGFSTPSFVPPHMPSTLPETKEQVASYWPEEMSTSESQSVVVILQNRAGAPIVPSIKVDGYSSALKNTEGISKPEGEYDAYASAVLDGATFDAKLNSVEWQSLKNSQTEWIWNVAPKSDRPVRGNQILNAGIKVQFKDKSGKVVTEDQLWQGNIQISVYQNWLIKDLPNVTSLIGTLCGAGLTVPWIYERVQRRRNQHVRRRRRRSRRRGRRGR